VPEVQRAVKDAVQRAVKDAVQRAVIARHATRHTLRHSVPTHLLEPATTSARSRSSSAHRDVVGAAVYTHVLGRGAGGGRSPLDGL